VHACLSRIIYVYIYSLCIINSAGDACVCVFPVYIYDECVKPKHSVCLARVRVSIIAHH